LNFGRGPKPIHQTGWGNWFFFKEEAGIELKVNKNINPKESGPHQGGVTKGFLWKIIPGSRE